MATVAQRMFWPRRLRTLKQSDWSDHDLVVYLSKMLHEEESICAEYLSGRRVPDRHRQLELGRLVSDHAMRQRRSIMEAVRAADESAPLQPFARGVYDAPFPGHGYRGLVMVAADGELLVEMRVHKRAQEKDMVPGFRAWLTRIEEKEAAEAQGLELVTLDDGEQAS